MAARERVLSGDLYPRGKGCWHVCGSKAAARPPHSIFDYLAGVARSGGRGFVGVSSSQRMLMTHQREPSLKSWMLLTPRAKGDVAEFLAAVRDGTLVERVRFEVSSGAASACLHIA